MLLLSCSVMSNSLVTPWTVAHQAPLSMGFSRQEYWSGCHFLPQEIFSIQGSNLHLLHWKVDSLPLSHHGSPKNSIKTLKMVHILKIYIFKKACIIRVTVGTACLLTTHLSESKETHEIEKNIHVEVCVQLRSYLEKRCKQI